MKTHVTVIPSDGIISVDGEVLFLDGIMIHSVITEGIKVG